MKNKRQPELMQSSPEFIKVVYDEKGRAIDVIPVSDVPSNSQQKKQNPQNPQNPQNVLQKQISQPVGQEVMVNWIVNLGQHIKALREDLRLLAIFSQKKFNELQPTISNLIEKEFAKNSPLIAERFGFIEGEISDLKKQYGLFLEKIQSFPNEISSLKNQYDSILENLQGNFQSFSNEISGLSGEINNLSNNLSGQINDLKEKLEGIKFPEEPILSVLDQLKSLDLRMSTVTNEIANSKLHEIETTEQLKSFLEKISILSQEIQDQKSAQKSVESAFGEKFDLINKELVAVNESMLQSNAQTQQMISQTQLTVSRIEEKLNEFSRISEELDSLKAKTAASVNELSENQNQMKSELLASQEQVSRTAMDEILKIQKMLRKPKKKPIKPQRAKVIKFLKKNFTIKPFSKVLVVTDKRNSVFGKTLYEATRSISKRSVFITVENKTSKSSLDKPVVEAIKQSNYAFIVGTYSLRKMKQISKTLGKVKILMIKRSLSYSVL